MSGSADLDGERGWSRADAERQIKLELALKRRDDLQDMARALADAVLRAAGGTDRVVARNGALAPAARAAVEGLVRSAMDAALDEAVGCEG